LTVSYDTVYHVPQSNVLLLTRSLQRFQRIFTICRFRITYWLFAELVLPCNWPRADSAQNHGGRLYIYIRVCPLFCTNQHILCTIGRAQRVFGIDRHTGHGTDRRLKVEDTIDSIIVSHQEIIEKKNRMDEVFFHSHCCTNWNFYYLTGRSFVSCHDGMYKCFSCEKNFSFLERLVHIMHGHSVLILSSAALL
jgi:hypothetical protein